MRYVAFRRMHPYKMSYFFSVTFIVGLIYTVIPVVYLNFIDNSPPSFLLLISRVYLALFFIQLLIVLLFFESKKAIKYQKIQSVIMPFYAYKFSVDPFLMYFFICYDSGTLSDNLYLIGFIVIGIGLVFMLFSIIRGIQRVQYGHLKKGGKGLFNFKDSTGYLGIQSLFGLALIAGTIPNLIQGYTFTDMLESLIFLMFCIVIHFPIVYYIQELILLAYCKNRFSSFNPKE